jgi:hypothetical protein
MAACGRLDPQRSSLNSSNKPNKGRKLIPYGKFALERGVAGKRAKLPFNEPGAISFTLRGRGDRTAT